MNAGGQIAWPDGVSEEQEIDRLTKEFTPRYGVWLSKNPSLEDTTELSRSIAKELEKIGAVKDVVSALEPEQSLVAGWWNSVTELFGSAASDLRRSAFARR